MDLEKRVYNLENLVTGLVKIINNQKNYSSADIAGVRKAEGNHNEDLKATQEAVDFLLMQ